MRIRKIISLLFFLITFTHGYGEVIKIGQVLVVREKGIIQLEAKVEKNSGWVQFLVFLQGYSWLQDECAIISNARLIDLQRAISLIDPKLWNDLWHRKIKGGRVIIEWNNNKKIETPFLLNIKKEELGIGDILFIGSPLWDRIVLRETRLRKCGSCPLFELEKEGIRKTFVRENGKSGYTLNKRMPPKGSKVRIEIRLE